MTDIVDRLRSDFVKAGEAEGEECACVMCEAAKEIERLRSWEEEATSLREALICARVWMQKSRESITDERERVSFDYAMDMVNSALNPNK